MTDQPSLFPELAVESFIKRVADQSRRAVPAEPKASDDDVPLLVARVQVEIEQNGKSYEEANWPKLSPLFRRAHNRLRVLRGLSPIPEPKIDLWLPAPVREISKFDSNNKEFIASAREFLGPRLLGGGAEGFEDKGSG